MRGGVRERRFLLSSISPVILAKAGIQRPTKPASRNQARIATGGSLLSSINPVIPAKAGIQKIEAKLATPKSGMNRERQSLLPIPPSFPRKRESRGFKPS